MTDPHPVRLPSLKPCAASVLLGFTLGAGAAPLQPVGVLPPVVASFVPPNVLMALSIEFPTSGAAYKNEAFDPAKTYLGYFDARKCYVIQTPDTRDHYFEESSLLSTDGRCSGKEEWSGNLMNWATMSTLDIYRLTMTGGNRARVNDTTFRYGADADNAGETFLARARIDTGVAGDFRKTVPKKVAQNRVPDRFVRSGDVQFSQGSITSTNISGSGESLPYGARIVVKACAPRLGVDRNRCRQYSGSWKPEGLIQQHARDMRFGVMTYLKENGNTRDGGVLRARLKFTGQSQQVSVPRIDDGEVEIDRVDLGAEWDAKTGVLLTNPDQEDAEDSSVANSGVINSINKFGDASGYKSNDPGAELFYAAQRYFRNKGNYAPYSNNISEAAKDGFPVITDWDDPIRYSCQKNFVIYLGDTNTHADMDLPGSTNSSKKPADEVPDPKDPAKAPDVHAWLEKIRDAERQYNGVTVDPNANTGSTNSRSYMAALAYWGNSVDVRPDLAGRQTIKAFTIDVVEGGRQKAEGTNAFYLAGKYGGFDDSNGNGVPDVASEWKDEAYPNPPYGKGMPKNFAQANRPEAMVKALTAAIAQVADSQEVALAGQGSNGPAVNSKTLVYRGRFQGAPLDAADKSGPWMWSGELEARRPSFWSAGAVTDGALVWRGSEKLPHASVETWNPASRVVSAFAPDQPWLVSRMRLTDDSTAAAQARIDWVLGGRSHEADGASPPLRKRPDGNLMGTVINSAPLYLDAPRRAPSGCSLPELLRKNALLAVGANDGLLHVFDANTGEAKYGYVPGAIHGKLAAATRRAFEHDYLVDGSPVGGMVCLGEVEAGKVAVGQAASVIAGTTGLGGAAVFLLDATAETLRARWEFSSADDADMGLSVAEPVLVRVRAGGSAGSPLYRDAVLVGNGLNSSRSRAVLFLLFVDKAAGSAWQLGRDYVKIAVGEDNSSDGIANGLMSPSAYDENGDGVTDFVYAGDVNGRLWKFDLRASAASAWHAVDHDPAAGETQPLYATAGGARQPVVAAPLLQPLVGGKVRVLFGTGKLFDGWNTDSVQSLYGLTDESAAQTPLTDVARQTVLGDAGGRIQVGSVEAGVHGWRLDLGHASLQSAQVIRPAAFFGSLVEFEAVMPSSDVCAPGGKSVLFRLKPGNGGQSDKPVFDTNGDGLVDDRDDKGGGWIGGSLLPAMPPAYKVIDGVLLQQSREGVLHRRIVRRLAWRELMGVDE
ncbi:pilus assembly protein [Crenobacter caeni]|uniref:PilY1 beta-propeller domain-containing protein n=1 Tax=Crenobacter caeni TaxID=2705474 RepID=A0A6B2KSJ8_9NEIS|nr:PilC/PilY family type IV pilus protein [Crenobacter caeni]NDV13118.1 hypothetical protein [Crenobacter caeni]